MENSRKKPVVHEFSSESEFDSDTQDHIEKDNSESMAASDISMRKEEKIFDAQGASLRKRIIRLILIGISIFLIYYGVNYCKKYFDFSK